MTVHSKNSSAASNVSPPVIIATVVLLLIVVGGLAFHFFGPNTATSTSGAPVNADQKWITDKAVEVKGDMNKLSPDDMQHLRQIGGQDAPNRFRDAWVTSQAGK